VIPPLHSTLATHLQNSFDFIGEGFLPWSVELFEMFRHSDWYQMS